MRKLIDWILLLLFIAICISEYGETKRIESLEEEVRLLKEADNGQ